MKTAEQRASRRAKKRMRQLNFARLWNMRYPVGTEVVVVLNSGKSKIGKTANVANALAGVPSRPSYMARAAVLVDGAGLVGLGEGLEGRIYRLSRVSPKAA